MEAIVLKNSNLRLEFGPSSGALIRLVSLKTGWEILSRPHLGLSFRILVPLPGRRNNPVYGEKQEVSDIKVSPDNSKVTFIWNSLISEYGGRHDIRLIIEVKSNGQQIVFTPHIDNHSEYMIENVYCPYLGDVQPPSSSEWFRTFLYNYGSAQEWSLYPIYQNMRGYYGVDYPTQVGPPSACGAPTTPFCLLRNASQGLYVGVYEPCPELVVWHTELRPGYGSSIDSRVPEEPSIDGKDVAIRFSAVHIPYIQPGESRELTPIMLQAFEGGWQKGVDIYKDWRNSWMKVSDVPGWAREPHAWQQIHIDSPEDELRIPFRELYKIGEDCAKHGVKAIQLVGWNKGGQDQGNPSHDPDPRLGTFEELKEAISRIQSMGVKVILFSKFTWADRATERFRNELIKYAIKDPYGDYYMHPGYQYQTMTQLLDINTKRLIPMCFLSEDYLKICEEEFRKVLDLGADGILFDECLHHGPALLCFDTSHGHRYGAPVYANDRKLIQNFARMVQDRPDFLFAGEACYDWEFEVYHLSYHRSENKQHIPLMRYMHPHMPIMTAVTGFNDRNMINQCLMYRYIISYEPYNFKGRLDDFPKTIAYGKQMDRLRIELREYFWDGEFRDKCGATVTTSYGGPHHPYSVFFNKRNGRLGLVIANYDEHRDITVKVKLDTSDSVESYRLVDDSQWRSAKQGIDIPPCSAVVVI